MWRARFMWRANRSVDVLLPFPCAAPDFVISYFISFFVPLSILWRFASTEVHNCLFLPLKYLLVYERICKILKLQRS